MLLFLHRCAGVLTLAAVLAGGSLPARAVAQGLTLADSERIAIDRDAMLREMRAQGAAMRERAVMDGELMDPQLRVGAVNVPVDSFSLDAEDMTMFEVGVVQEFKPGRSRQLSRKQMLQLATAMDATALDREWIVRREVRKLWTQLAFVGSAKALLADQAGWVEQMRQSARARYVGRGQATRCAAGRPRRGDAA